MQFEYFDLVKVLKDIDSKKGGSIDYNDFSKWMGGVIHKSEGFYFRHDSVKNPSFESGVGKRAAAEARKRKHSKMTPREVEQAIVKKIEF